jgi:hypothetical protein
MQHLVIQDTLNTSNLLGALVLWDYSLGYWYGVQQRGDCSVVWSASRQRTCLTATFTLDFATDKNERVPPRFDDF